MTSTGCLIETVDKIGQRHGAQLPSEATIHKATQLLTQRRIMATTHPVVLYHVEGDHGRYMVALSLCGDEVIDGECSCPSETTCSHLLAVLAARLRGQDEGLAT